MSRPVMGKTCWKLLDQAVRTHGLLTVERGRKQDMTAARLLVSLGYLALDEVITGACRKSNVYLITSAGRTALSIRAGD